MARIISPANQEVLEIRYLVGSPVSGKDLQTRITDVRSDLTALDGKVGSPAALGGGTATLAGMLASIGGTSFSSTDSLKDLKAAVMAIQNNTSFTASVVPQMIIPASSNSDFHNLVNVYDGAGNMEDPDLSLAFAKVESGHGVSRNANLFEAASRSTAATKLVVYTITAPSVAPTATAVYKDSADTEFTVIGMIGTTKLVASWTGATAPVLGTGTLTNVSGTGDASLTASAVDATYVSMTMDAAGQYSLFYNVTSSHAEENLTFRFGYFEAGLWHAFDRSSNVVSPANVAGQADAIWDEATAGHTTAGTFGKLALDIKSDTGTALTNIGTVDGKVDIVDSNVDAIKAKTDNLPANTATTLSGIAGDVTSIKAKTDNLPADPADQSAVEAAITSAHSTTDGKIDAAKAVVDAIKSKTDNLPSDPADQSAVEAAITSAHGTTDGKIDDAQSDITAIKAKTDNLPANTSTELDAIDSAIAAIKTLPQRVVATKTSGAIANAASAVIDLDTAAGFNCQSAQLFDVDVAVASGATTDFTVEICEKSDGSYTRFQIANIVAGDPSIFSANGIIVYNRDAAPGKHLYARITNNADVGTSTFTVGVRGIALQDAAI